MPKYYKVIAGGVTGAAGTPRYNGEIFDEDGFGGKAEVKRLLDMGAIEESDEPAENLMSVTATGEVNPELVSGDPKTNKKARARAAKTGKRELAEVRKAAERTAEEAAGRPEEEEEE